MFFKTALTTGKLPDIMVLFRAVFGHLNLNEEKKFDGKGEVLLTNNGRQLSVSVSTRAASDSIMFASYTYYLRYLLNHKIQSDTSRRVSKVR